MRQLSQQKNAGIAFSRKSPRDTTHARAAHWCHALIETLDTVDNARTGNDDPSDVLSYGNQHIA